MVSMESRRSWVVAFAALAVTTVGFGAPMTAVVALKPIAASLDVPRSIPALALSAAYMGSAIGGLLMGWVADRFGARRIGAFGLAMIVAGLLVSAQGSVAALLLGHGVLIGLLGIACLFAPLVTLVSRWFDRRRGTAVALVASGQYVAGVLWPSLLQWATERLGWQAAMDLYALLVVAVLPLCLLLRAAPAQMEPLRGDGRDGGAVLGLPPNVVQGLLAVAIFLCCIPMAMPQGHLVAFCTDIGLSAGQGAATMSLMLGIAFVSRQFWGWLSDRMGGLVALLAGSAVQAAAMAGFLLTRDEAGLLLAAMMFGVGFSGLVPAYIVTVRELFPNREAGWRVPIMLLAGQASMALGGWLAGAIYDGAGAYSAAFAVGVLFNLLNLVVLAGLLMRWRWAGLAPA